jgi:hypothetical protein
MDAPTLYARARSVAAGVLTVAIAAAVLAVGGAAPRALADDLGSVDVNSKATFSVIPKRCYTPSGEVRSGPCRIERYGDGRPTVIVWGDSHAAQQIPALRVKARQTRTNLISFSMGLCPPMIVAKSDPDPCSRNAYEAMQFIEAKAARTSQPLTVVLGGFWYFYRTTKTGDRSERAATFRRGDHAMFTRLGRLSRQHGVRVAVLGQAPWIPPGSPCSERAKSCRRSVMIPAEASQTRYLKRQVRSIAHAEIVDVAAQVCTGHYCRVTACDVPVFYDIVHLNADLTRRFTAMFDWTFWEGAHRYGAAPCGVATGQR